MQVPQDPGETGSLTGRGAPCCALTGPQPPPRPKSPAPRLTLSSLCHSDSSGEHKAPGWGVGVRVASPCQL